MPPTQLVPDDLILVGAGERIGADGTVVSGRSEIDRSLLDGETLPQAVGPGSPVHAGMSNLSALLRIRVTATGEDTYLAEITRLMEAAEHGRMRFVALADRVARVYAPAVHGLALAAFVGWLLAGSPWPAALTVAIAVLIITCPCALGLAIPVVQVIAAKQLMRRGILLKSGTALERLAAVDAVAFDKTGTLTLGRPALAADPDAAALATASALAAAGRHVLMVGDGLNDAPALAAALVSMSPSGAAEVSQNAADIVFEGQSLAAVAEVLAVARASRALVRENLGLAVLYNAVAIPLAMVGWVTPLIAAVAMSSSSLVVILNALRLRTARLEGNP